MAKNSMNVLKGIGAGLAAGIVTGVVSTIVMKDSGKNKKTLSKMFDSVGNALDSLEEMFK